MTCQFHTMEDKKIAVLNKGYDFIMLSLEDFNTFFEGAVA